MSDYLWLVWCDAGDHHGPDFRPTKLFKSYDDACTWIMLQGEGKDAAYQYRIANTYEISEVRIAEPYDLLSQAERDARRIRDDAEEAEIEAEIAKVCAEREA